MYQSACSMCNSSESNEKVQGELSQTCGNLTNGSSTEAIVSAGAWAHPMLSFLWRRLQAFGLQVERTGPAYFRTALQKSVSRLLKPHSGRRERVNLREQHLSSFLRCYNWFLPPFGDCGLQSPMFLQAVFRRRSLWLAPVTNVDRLGRENLTVINKRQKLIDSNPCTWIITSYPFCLVWQRGNPTWRNRVRTESCRSRSDLWVWAGLHKLPLHWRWGEATGATSSSPLCSANGITREKGDER